MSSLPLVLLAACGLLVDHVVCTPISMQDPDVQFLIFEELHISTALYGPFALVQNTMVFRNPQWKTLEGRFKFTLPHGATISRFAMEIQQQMMEGEVVDKQKAR